MPDPISPYCPKLHVPDYLLRKSQSELNPARWTYQRLGEYIQAFEATLDQDHEIGARLVSFGQALVFHIECVIECVGYYGPDLISFEGVNEAGEQVQLIQNISQLSVLLIAMKKGMSSLNESGLCSIRKRLPHSHGAAPAYTKGRPIVLSSA